MKFPVMLLPLLVTMEVPGKLVVATAESAVDSSNGHTEKVTRVRRSSECEAKYREYRSTHTLCLTDDADATEVPLTEDMKASILGMHNDYRKGVSPMAADMIKLVWDDRLARSARKWAMQCPRDHDNIKDRGEPDWPGIKIGQNIGLGHKDFSVMLRNMYNEKERYTFGQQFVKRTGHFLQLVSAKTVRVGCAESRCPNTEFKRYRVCNYAPAMDTSRNPYTNGTSCASCMDHCVSSGKLCDCRNKLCLHSGTLGVNACQCNCQQIFTGDKCQDVNCDGEDLPPCRGKHSIYTRSDCGKGRGFLRDPNMCPKLCGLCEGHCPGKKCYDGHHLDESQCKCECQGTMTGGEICEHMKRNRGATHLRESLCTQTVLLCLLWTPVTIAIVLGQG